MTLAINPLFHTGTNAERLLLNPGLLPLGLMFYATDTTIFWHIIPGVPNTVWGPMGGGGTALEFPHHYLVDNSFASAVTPTGPFPTISAAIAKATADGYGPNDPATITIVRGTYPESFTLPIGISLSSDSDSLFGSSIEGTITIGDTVGTERTCTISGLRIVPTVGNSIEFGGVESKFLSLSFVNMDPTGAGAIAINYNNTSPDSAIVAINCDTASEGGIVIDDATTGLFVYLSGGIRNTLGTGIAIHTGGGNVTLKDVVGSGGRYEYGPGNAQVVGSVFYGPQFVLSGTTTFQELQAVGDAVSSPLNISMNGTAVVLGTFKAQCDPLNKFIVSGSGTLLCPADIQSQNGTQFGNLLTWGTSGLSVFRPHIQIVFTADPGANPFIIDGGIESIVVLADLSGPWTFRLPVSGLSANGVDVVVKNLDNVNIHTVDVVVGEELDRVPGGSIALPITGGVTTARAMRGNGGWFTR